MRFVLGFDGGGTKTDGVLMDEALVVRARSRGGPSNPMRVGFGGALNSICEAANDALREANIEAKDIAAICAGLAGAGHSDAESKMQHLLRNEFPAALLRVCTDLDLTLESARDGDVVVLIAGTGSAAVGRDADGQIARVGGHGPLLGDEGSAYDIGRRASMRMMRDFDKTQANSKLATAILREAGVKSWDEFRTRAMAVPDDVFPRIFSIVAGHAESGDRTAQHFLQNAAHELAALVTDLEQRLQLAEKEFSLVKTGGMIGRSKFFDKQLDECLRQAAPHAEFGELAVPPAEAAAHLALRLLAQPTGGEK